MESNSLHIESQIEAILFFKGEPIRIKELSKLLSKSDAEIKTALDSLQETLQSRGVRLMRKEDEAAMATAPEVAALIEKVRKNELARDIGKAGLETLSVILYKGPVSRSQIDYIRGVNSTFILRNLLIRGLVERVSNPADNRSYLYKSSFQLLSFLGISTIKELPGYAEVQDQLKSFMDDLEKTEEETEQEHKIESET